MPVRGRIVDDADIEKLQVYARRIIEVESLNERSVQRIDEMLRQAHSHAPRQLWPT